MIPWHVVSGMSGAILVLPRNGLSDHEGKPVSYNKVYYIGENVLFVHSQANRDSRPHLIGGHGDLVCKPANSTTRQNVIWKPGSFAVARPEPASQPMCLSASTCPRPA